MEPKAVMDHNDIANCLPHRAPILLVDRVLEMKLGESIHATKCVSALDPYLAGHFPGNPVVPGVYLIEGLAQASAILSFKTLENAGGKDFERVCLLTGVDEVRFRKPVVPGDVIHYHAKQEKIRFPFVWFTGEIKVDNEVVAQMKISAMLGSGGKKGAK